MPCRGTLFPASITESCCCRGTLFLAIYCREEKSAGVATFFLACYNKQGEKSAGVHFLSSIRFRHREYIIYDSGEQ